MRDATTVQIRDSFSFWEKRFPRADWAAAQTSLFGFLDGLGATEDAHTITVRLVPREIESPRQFVDHLMTETSGDGAWSFVTTTRSSSGEHDGQARMLTYVRMTSPPGGKVTWPSGSDCVTTCARSWPASVRPPPSVDLRFSAFAKVHGATSEVRLRRSGAGVSIFSTWGTAKISRKGA